MNSRSVDSHQWKAFADSFTRLHDGWIASLQIQEAGSPARVEVDDSPFRGATMETRNGRETLVLTFGYEPEEHFAHIIRQPRALIASEASDHTAASLLVDVGSGVSCVLGLVNPLREEDFVGA
jgi:hypothetical protein